MKQERNSNQDSIAINDDVVSNVVAVLNTVDNKHLVLILPYDGTKPKPSRESGLPIAITQTMSGDGAINGKKARNIAPRVVVTLHGYKWIGIIYKTFVL